MFAETKPSSIELKQLSSLKHELLHLKLELTKCPYDDVEYYETVKSYIESRIDSIQRRV